MRIKAIYRKNLKMSEGKLAAQVAHAVKNLGETPIDCDIIVLGVSDKKFWELSAANPGYIKVDKGLTEVDANISYSNKSKREIELQITELKNKLNE